MAPVVVALFPVVIFRVLLMLFDSFKLVPAITLSRALIMGAAIAVLASMLHAWLLRITGWDPEAFSRYIAPVTEETLKALVVLYPLRKRQVAFLVDAAILGFAVGAGFALVENVEYLRALPDRSIWVWIARGFGSAILHATTTAIVAIVAKSLIDRGRSRGAGALLPGLLTAILLHALFNRALVSPVLAAAVLMLVLPLVVIFIFNRSEKTTRDWVSDGLDLDVELLQLVQSNQFGTTRLGKYLHELRARFPGPVVADMFCLMQLDLELAIRAKGLLLARETGLEVPADEALAAKLAERKYLERAIGQTGLLALRPLQVSSDRDDWHQYLLEHTRR